MSSRDEIADQLLSKLKASPFLMIGIDDTPDHSEPMTALLDPDKPSADTLWFFTTKDNRIAIAGPAMAQFAAKGHDFFACLHGTLSPHDDRATIDRLWSKQVEAWYPRGKDDPSLLLLRYDIDSVELWEAHVSLAGRVRMLFGADMREEEKGKHTLLTL